MKIDYKVPFYSNTPDDTHCFQAALRMVLKFFQPDKEYSWEELEKITAKIEGLWTWPYAGYIWMVQNGYEIRDIDPFDTKRFIAEGGDYIIAEYGKEVGSAQIKHSNIDREREYARRYFEIVKSEQRIPTDDELKKFLDEKFLITCNVNSSALNNKKGYAGHFIVVKGYDKTGFIVHDPGLPPLENRHVDFKTFDRAWSYPDQKARNIVAIRLSGVSTFV